MDRWVQLPVNYVSSKYREEATAETIVLLGKQVNFSIS
jgi:hypothetical protein